MRRLKAAIARPHEVEGVSVSVRASIGLAHALGEPDTAEAMIRRADAAMYRDKSGKGSA